jgi:WD40 repeat protein
MRMMKLSIPLLLMCGALFTSQPAVRAQDYPTCNTLTDAHSIAFSPDGNYLVAGKQQSTLMWDVQSGKLIRQLPHTPASGEAVQSNRNYVAYSPDGKFIATSRAHEVVLWDAQTGTRRYTFSGESETGLRATFTPDSTNLLVVGTNGGILWNTQTGEKERQFSDLVGSSRYSTVQLSPDGKFILTNGNFYITVWNVEFGQIVLSIPSGYPAQFAPAVGMFVPGTDTLMIDSGHEATFWDMETREQIKHLPIASGIWQISPDGKYGLVSKDGTAILDLQSGKTIFTLQAYYPYVYLLPDSRHIVGVVDEANGLHEVRDISSGKQSKTFSLGAGTIICQLVASPDGKYVAVEKGPSPRVIELWDVVTLDKIRTYSAP